MTPAESKAIEEAAARAAADAPPLPAGVAEMLRHDRCPIVGRKSAPSVLSRSSIGPQQDENQRETTRTSEQ